MSLAPHAEQPGALVSGIDDVPARRWANNTCAAGALSEVLNSLGDPVSEEALGKALPKARRGGVVSVDLLIAARARGHDAQLIKGDVPLLFEQLAHGQPLILMLRVLDAPGHADDLFHYVVLSGVDREKQLVRLHYGDGKQRWVSPEKLRAAWAAAGQATIFVDAKRNPSVDDNDLRRAVLLEEAGKTREALALYRRFTNAHPLSAVGWTNLGNTQARTGDAAGAEAAYRNALVVEPDHFDALNNLAWLLFEQNRLDEAETLARRAVSQNDNDRPVALDTLERILAAKNGPQAASRPSHRPQADVSTGQPPRSRRPLLNLMGVLAATTIYDVEATFYRLNHCDECTEANPLFRPFVERGRVATYAFSAALNAVVMVVAKRQYERGNPWWDLFGITVSAVHAGAGTWNLLRGNDE